MPSWSWRKSFPKGAPFKTLAILLHVVPTHNVLKRNHTIWTIMQSRMFNKFRLFNGSYFYCTKVHWSFSCNLGCICGAWSSKSKTHGSCLPGTFGDPFSLCLAVPCSCSEDDHIVLTFNHGGCHEAQLRSLRHKKRRSQVRLWERITPLTLRSLYTFCCFCH